MRYFCTYFDSNYLTRGLSLISSLQRFCKDFKIFVLCLDTEAQRILEELKIHQICTIALAELEKHDPQLLAAKETRSKVEYYFTCTPALPAFVLERWPEVDLITYLDADFFFFNDIEPAFAELAGSSIAITAHGFGPSLQKLEEFGRYNVGWVSFRRDKEGLRCLYDWRARCIE